MKSQLSLGFEQIAATENLLEAWREFLSGKRGKRDVQEFQLRLMDNILSLNYVLLNGRYRHGGYMAFNISDPKPRNIHKASVRDRLLHRAIYRVLISVFQPNIRRRLLLLPRWERHTCGDGSVPNVRSDYKQK